MKLEIILILLLVTALIPLTILEISAKCMEDERCLGTPIFRTLKTQVLHDYQLSDITCPNQDHLLVERPNGELAYISERMTEKTGWRVHYGNELNMRAQDAIWANGYVSFAYFEITGAEFDQIVYEDQRLIASVIPNEKSGLLSLDLPFGVPSGNLEYCNPDNENPFNTPYVIIIDGTEYELNEGVNSRDQTAVNIPLTENSETIEIIRTCNESSEELLKTPNGKNPEMCPLSFSSRCFTATMTETIDGDTIRVSQSQISLALIDAPHLDEKGGKEAWTLIEFICPKGSDVLIDQDDLRPLDGYGGTSIPSAVAYCNGVNLNEQLIKLPEVQLRSALCSTSEFAEEPWARDNGCTYNERIKFHNMFE